MYTLIVVAEKLKCRHCYHPLVGVIVKGKHPISVTEAKMKPLWNSQCTNIGTKSILQFVDVIWRSSFTRFLNYFAVFFLYFGLISALTYALVGGF
jgi:hypothetical protein